MRVISVTPAGRRRYMAILARHLLRHQHVIDAHYWWQNTDIAEDIAFIRQTCRDYPDFFHISEKPFDASKTHGDNIWKFFRDFAEPDVIYVRFDDDIVWMADNAVENLVTCRRDNPDAPLILGNIVNNAICSAAHQRAGLISERHGIVQPHCEDWIGWRNGRFARHAHETFLTDVACGRWTRWTEPSIELDCGQRFSINVISWLGGTLAALPELAFDDWDEEPYLTERLPRMLGRANIVCSEALFAHFAFYPQRPFLDWTSNDLLERYQALAEDRLPEHNFANAFWRHDATWRVTKPFRKVRRSVRKRLGMPIT